MCREIGGCAAGAYEEGGLAHLLARDSVGERSSVTRMWSQLHHHLTLHNINTRFYSQNDKDGIFDLGQMKHMEMLILCLAQPH